MAVPRKRKKLAETAEKPKSKNSPQRHRKQMPKTKKALSGNASQKIDTAFEIMDHIEEEISDDISLTEETATGYIKPASTLERLGFRFHISLDAVMPEKKTEGQDRSSPPVNKSSLLDIGLTIPFFWRMPIIGGIAQKVIRNIKTFKI